MTAAVCSSSKSSLSRLSNSDYGSGSVSSDEEFQLSDDQRSSPDILQPGICPCCKNIYQEPVSLRCGHSLCSSCCSSQLSSSTSGTSWFGIRRTRIRMGTRSKAHHLQIPDMDMSSCSLSTSTFAPSRYRVAFQSPQCTVCGAPPSITPPVPNVALTKILTAYKLSINDNPAYREEPLQNRLDTEKVGPIRQLAVIGAPSVGKSTLIRVQYGNEIFMSDINPVYPEEKSTCLIDFMDCGLTEESLNKAEGFMIVYSITDENSFNCAVELIEEILLKKDGKMPIVLVGSNADQEKKRKVLCYQGQQLARKIDCPFREVSAKKNHCVNEAFIELLRLVECNRS